MSNPRKVVIMGAAGRDFHDFNCVYRDNGDYRVVAFTAAQIPDIAGRRYPSELAGGLYPDGIPIRDEAELESLIAKEGIDEVVFAYSDVTHLHVMDRASRVIAAGADFRLLGARDTSLKSSLPVVAVCAVRTGCGKSQTSRHIASLLQGRGQRVAVIRHPMPYGDLHKQAVQRFARMEDLTEADCTIEEREEYEPHIAQGSAVFAGVDYHAILDRAEVESDVILWDGGNNDLPFYVPDLHVVVADPFRSGHERTYHPGQANVMMADVVIINKVDSAEPESVTDLRNSIENLNPGAQIIEARSEITTDSAEPLAGKSVLVVEDGPTLTHGGMAFGAGAVFAQRQGARLVDPRQWAVGSIQDTFDRYPHVGAVLPAMGYSESQVDELRQTIQSTPSDLVVVGTPIDLGRLVPMDRPAVRVCYELKQVSGPSLDDLLGAVLVSR